MSVKVSVVMSVYQNDDFLPMAIESILNQTYSSFEFIIINDNPEDEGLQKELDCFEKKDRRIVLIRNRENLGLGASLNRGLEIAKGEYIARMDSDDISLPKRLERQVAYLESHLDIVLVGTWAQRIDENGNDLDVMRLSEKHELLVKMLHYSTASIHPSWMFRKSILEELSGYRPFPVAQDYDFLHRLIDKGFKVSNVQEVLLKYRVSSSNLSVKNFMDQWNCRNYIKRLHKEREKSGDDSFTEKNLAKVLNVSPFIRKLYDISHYYQEKSVHAKRTHNIPHFILYLLISLMIYPGKISVVYGAFRSRMLLRKGDPELSDLNSSGCVVENLLFKGKS